MTSQLSRKACLPALVGGLASLLMAPSSFALEADVTSEPRITTTTAEQLPQVAYAREAFGNSAKRIGAAAVGVTRFQSSVGRKTWFGGGVRAWGSPVDRLTLLAEGQRRDNGEFAPAVGAQVRILGDRPQHYALGASAQYLSEGFAELEGEVELGLLASYAKTGLHLDLNTVLGAGFEGEEVDGELLARIGYDVVKHARLGIEARGRQRLGGDKALAGNRKWDALAGAQALFSYDPAFFALTFGPSTIGVADGVGWSAIASFGGVAF